MRLRPLQACLLLYRALDQRVVKHEFGDPTSERSGRLSQKAKRAVTSRTISARLYLQLAQFQLELLNE